MKPPDPRKSTYVFASGKKGEGKSYYCRAWFDSYPFDRLVIDVTGDIRDDLRNDGVEFTDLDPMAIPTRFPSSLREDQPYVTCVMVPDMGSPTALDDMDRAIGLCLRGKGRPSQLWVDEWGAVTTANKTPPNARRVLHHGRHHDLSFVAACPRPKDIDTLTIAQADLVATWRTPNHYDRDTIANAIGYDPGEFTRENNQLRDHRYTLFDATEGQLYIMPALPRRRAGINPYMPLPA